MSVVGLGYAFVVNCCFHILTAVWCTSVYTEAYCQTIRVISTNMSKFLLFVDAYNCGFDMKAVWCTTIARKASYKHERKF